MLHKKKLVLVVLLFIIGLFSYSQSKNNTGNLEISGNYIKLTNTDLSLELFRCPANDFQFYIRNEKFYFSDDNTKNYLGNRNGYFLLEIKQSDGADYTKPGLISFLEQNTGFNNGGSTGGNGGAVYNDSIIQLETDLNTNFRVNYVPYLPFSDELKYENTDTGEILTGIKYSNNQNEYINIKSSIGFYTSYKSLPENIILYSEQIGVFPTLPLQETEEARSSFNKDIDDFQLNISGASSNNKNVEYFLENKPYEIIGDLVLPEGVEYKTGPNMDGTFNHLFSVKIIGWTNIGKVTGTLQVKGDNDNGSNPPVIFVEITN